MLTKPFKGNAYTTSPYSPTHLGVDYALNNRTAIVATTDGVVSFVENNIESKTGGIRSWIANRNGDPFLRKFGIVIIERPTPDNPQRFRSLLMEDYGNRVDIDHGKGVMTRYAHLDEVVVREGQVVKEGELIGFSDSTGNSTGGHIHYEIIVEGKRVNPGEFNPDFQGEIPKDKKQRRFFPIEDGLVSIRKDVYPYLSVRSRPDTNAPLSGSKLLYANTSNLRIDGVIEGEEIEVKFNDKETVKTNLWFKSFKGNYFWAGATNEFRKVLSSIESLNITEEEKQEKLRVLYEQQESIVKRLEELDNKLEELQREKIELDTALIKLNSQITEIEASVPVNK